KGTTTTVVSQRVQRAEAVEPQRAWRRRSLGGTLRILLTDSAVREPMASDATDLAGCYNACFNRRMRKTARPVVWEGDEAQSSSLDPIRGLLPICQAEHRHGCLAKCEVMLA